MDTPERAVCELFRKSEMIPTLRQDTHDEYCFGTEMPFEFPGVGSVSGVEVQIGAVAEDFAVYAVKVVQGASSRYDDATRIAPVDVYCPAARVAVQFRTAFIDDNAVILDVDMQAKVVVAVRCRVDCMTEILAVMRYIGDSVD